MDLLFSVVGPAFVQKRAVAADGMTVTADGYVPRASVSGKNVRGAERSSGNDSGGLGPVLVEVTLRLALFAGCMYTSVRFTQFLRKLKERENQVSVQTNGRLKLKNYIQQFTAHPCGDSYCCTRRNGTGEQARLFHAAVDCGLALLRTPKKTGKRLKRNSNMHHCCVDIIYVDAPGTAATAAFVDTRDHREHRALGNLPHFSRIIVGES